MLKKMFVVLTLVAGVSVFAAADFKSVNYTNLTAEQVAQLKTSLNGATGRDAACCAIAVAKFEAKRDLTLDEMMGVAKKYVSATTSQVNAVIAYISKTNVLNKYVGEMVKNDNINKSEYFAYLVVSGRANVDNPSTYCFYIIKNTKLGKDAYRAVNRLVEYCNNISEDKAVVELKKAYQIILPRLADYPDFKTAATKIGLALKSYGVDVK